MRQHLLDDVDARILLDVELLVGQNQRGREKDGEAGNGRDCGENQHDGSVAGRLDSCEAGHELAHGGRDGRLLTVCSVLLHVLSQALELRFLLVAELLLERCPRPLDVRIIDS